MLLPIVRTRAPSVHPSVGGYPPAGERAYFRQEAARTVSTFPTLSATRLAVEHELFLLGHRNLQAHVFGQAGLSLLVAMGA